MTLLTQRLSKPAGAIRLVTFVLFLAALGSFAYVANAGGYTVTAPDDQVSFTATGTGVLTGVTHLPGGLTQLNFDGSGKATKIHVLQVATKKDAVLKPRAGAALAGFTGIVCPGAPPEGEDDGESDFDPEPSD